MPSDSRGPVPSGFRGEVPIELVVRLDAAIDHPESRATLRAAIGDVAADARRHSIPPELMLVLIKSHLWAKTSELDMIARRELVDVSVRWAIEEYYRAR